MTSPPDPDVPRLLGLTGPGAWVLTGLFWATYIVLIVLSGGAPMRTVEGWIAFVLTLALAVVLVLPGRHPLRLPIVFVTLGVVAFSTVAIVWHLSPSGWPGWTSWSFGSNTFLLFMLALRGRVWWGAAGEVLMMALTLHWSWATTGDVGHGFDLTYRQLATYSAGAFFAAWLRRTARRIVEFQETEQRRAREEQVQESTARERDRELDRVLRIAGPALAEIRDGRPSARRRREHGLLEARLRDDIRGRALVVDGPVREAVLALRSRGARVAVLDDLPRDTPADDVFLGRARSWVAGRLAALPDGEVTVRIALTGGRPVVTIATADDPGESLAADDPD